MGKFLKALKEKKSWPINARNADASQIPPREVCAECVVKADEWVEIGPEGIVSILDITYYASPDPLTGESCETPYVAAILCWTTQRP
ncbi:MAG: hypothetical protein R2860_14420 [Desulfobacterales bacterium]